MLVNKNPPAYFRVELSKTVSTEIYVKMDNGKEPSRDDLRKEIAKFGRSDWDMDDDFDIESYESIEEKVADDYYQIDLYGDEDWVEEDVRCTETPDMFGETE